MGNQVYTATHDGEGNSLSVMDKHFISFSYGGKNIEDFNLISITTNNRLSRNFSASFQNTTSQYVGLDGQHFWLSTYDPLRFTFNLATDGMTEKEIEDFKKHFKPGIEKELILSEHPNRYIMARVETVPTYSFLPFEKEETITFSKIIKKTRTTEYKGEASITFVADEPFWYSKENYHEVNIGEENLLSEEQLKTYFEDGVPISSLIPNSVILGENKIKINGSIEQLSNNSITINSIPSYYLYNPSSATVKPEITFTFMPQIESNYISYPANTINNPDMSIFQYSNIKIGDYIFEYTTPSVLTAMNQAIKIANTFFTNNETSSVDLIYKIREGVHHYKIRAIVAGILTEWKSNSNYVDINTGAFKNSNWCSDLVDRILSYLPESMTASFNSQTGNAIIKYTLDGVEYEEKAGDMVKSNYIILEEGSFKANGEMITTSECLPITSSNEITDFKINYRYTYL